MTKPQRARERDNRQGLDRQLRIAADEDKSPSVRKRASRTAAYLAERLGIIARPDRCSWCRHRQPLERHHPQHERPLEVIFLCRSCHMVANEMTWSEASA